MFILLYFLSVLTFVTCYTCNETNDNIQTRKLTTSAIIITSTSTIKSTSKRTNTSTSKSTSVPKSTSKRTSTSVSKSTNVPKDGARSSNYVYWNGRDFILDKDIFVPVGFNAYWLGYTEEYTYPSHEQIEEMFMVAKQMGATVIRSHTLGFSGGSKNSLRPFDNNLNKQAWEPIDYSFRMANKYNIKLVIPLIDGYDYFHGSYGEFCKTRGVDKTQFWTNKDVRADFKEYISLWLNHVNRYTGISIKQDSSLFLIELGNELGNIRPGVGSTTIPTQDWITDISSWIKSIDKNHLVLNGADESLGTSNDFNIDSLDVYSGHFYGKDYWRVDYGSNNAKNVGKPYIIGEYDCHFGDDWFREIERRPNVKGTIFWNMYPHTNGYKGGNIIPHNDGYTLHYPEDNITLTRISKHFNSMKSRVQV